MFSQGSKLHIYLINFLSIWNNRIKEFSYFYQKVLKPPRILLNLLIFLILSLVLIESLALAQNVTVNNSVTVNQAFDLNQTIVDQSNCTYIEEKNNTEESNSTTEIVDNSTTENASEPNSTIIVNTSVITTVSEPTSAVTITSIETTTQITSETTSTVVTSTLNPTLTSDSTTTVVTTTTSPQTTTVTITSEPTSTVVTTILGLNTTQQTTIVSTTSTSTTTIQLENTKIQLVPRVNDEVKDNENKTVGKKIQDEIDYETFFTFVGKGGENFVITFYHNSTKVLPVWVEGDIDYYLSATESGPSEEVNLTVPLVNDKIPKFRLHVGYDSDVFEFGITVINIQSYPTVGGNWTVRFDTVGTADLVITGFNGTNFGEKLPDDLEFLELRCGNDVLIPEFGGNSIVYEDYSCNEIGYEISRILTSGKHILEFKFGDDVEYAYNQANWADSNCNYRKLLTFDKPFGSGNLTNFTVMVLLNSTRIDYSKTSETDIRFYDDDNSTKLKHHWEIWNETGNSYGWVKVPLLENTTEDYIWVYYGCSDTVKQDEGGTYDDYYLLVYHLNETNLDNEPGDIKDSTYNGNNGTTVGMESGDYTIGQSGGCLNFEAAEYIDTGLTYQISNNAPVSVFVWVKDIPSGNQYVVSQTDSTPTYSSDFILGYPNNGFWGDSQTVDGSNIASNGNWHQLGFTMISTGGSSRLSDLYIDGEYIGSATGPTADALVISVKLMSRGDGGAGASGKLDEVRISDTNRSADWINASYLTMKDEFINYGNEEDIEIEPLTVSLEYPNTLSTNISYTVDFAYIPISIGDEIYNCSIWTNETVWSLKVSNTSAIVNNSVNIITEIFSSDGVYEWNIECYNSAHSVFADSNWTIEIDAGAPSVEINSPVGTLSDTTPLINLTFGEVVDTAWYNIDDGENITLCTSCSSTDNEYLDLQEGSYTIYVFVNNSVGILNDTESSSFTIDMNGNYYDNYDDNSSISLYNNVDWVLGNLSFEGFFNWWNDSWINRKEIVITNAGSSVLTDFPAYINVSKAPDMKSDYSDLRFIDGSCDSNGEIQLDYEIENYTSSKADVWIRIPSLSLGATSICMYYNNSNAEAGENPEGVWEINYRGVYHLNEKGTTVSRNDSTQFNNDMDTLTGFDGDEDIEGIVGGATDFDGTDDILLGPSSNSLTGDYLQTVTFSAWVKHSNSGDPGYISSVKRSSTASTLMSLDGESAGNLGFLTATYDQSPAHDWMTAGTTYNDDDWHYLVATVNGSTRTLYIDGEYKDSDSEHGIQNVSGNTAAFSIGGFSTNNILFDGTIDEVRFSRTAKNADWVNQTYQMIWDQGSFVSFGTEESETSVNKLKNTGSTDIFGYLVMEIQTNTSGEWEWISTQINDTNIETKRSISTGENLDLSYVWNSSLWNTTSENSGHYRLNFAFNDPYGNVLTNDTNDPINKTYEFYVDTGVPGWSNNSTSVPSGPNYQPDQNYGFQINWVDEEEGLDDIVFRLNNTNYSCSKNQVSNLDDTYYINFTDLTAGVYFYQWYANDSVDNVNSTDQLSYHIIQDSTLTRLFLNGTEGDKNNYRIGDVVNFTIILDATGQDIYLDTNISGWNIVKGTDSILFNTTSFNESGVYNITGFFNASIGSGYQSSFVTYYATVSGYPANYTDFDDPEKTDFNSVPDIENVSQPTIAKTNTAKVTWNGFINASGTDFDQNIIYTNNNVTILSQNLNNTFNSSANITMYYLNYTETPVIYRD
ncbi:MAG: DUF2341 domain-containing protein, partial [Candidatus Aenigmarchaeota archaeon]|nr:DUF2341 domain-containing protein [Candidatus Aenigmarchaeota archaeon]